MKKLIAIILAVMMLASFSVSALATSVPGTGDVYYVDLDVFDVLIPTAQSLDFTLDPQGLLGLPIGQPTPVGDLSGGRIHSSDVARVVSESSVPAAVTIALRAYQPTGTDAEFVNTVAAVGANNDNNILLYAIPSAVNVYNVSTAPYLASGFGHVIGTTQTNMVFVFEAADFTVTNQGGGVFDVDLVPDSGHGSAIQLGGYVNSYASWLAFSGGSPTQSVAMEALFSFARATQLQIDGMDPVPVAGVPGLLSPTAGLTLVPPFTFDVTLSGARDIVITSTGAPVTFPTTAAGFQIRRVYEMGGSWGGFIAATTVTGTGDTRTISPIAGWNSGWEQAQIVFTSGTDVITITLARATLTGPLVSTTVSVS